MAKRIYKSKTGYSCPKCEAICSEKTLMSRTKPVLCDGNEKYYTWDEKHKCFKCDTMYILNNGT